MLSIHVAMNTGQPCMSQSTSFSLAAAGICKCLITWFKPDVNTEELNHAEHRRHPPNRMATDAASFTPFDDCFQMTRLATVESKRKAKEAEYFWIMHYAQNSSGYNICRQDPTTDKRFWFLRRLAALG